MEEILQVLCQRDVTKYDAVKKVNVITAFNTLYSMRLELLNAQIENLNSLQEYEYDDSLKSKK